MFLMVITGILALILVLGLISVNFLWTGENKSRVAKILAFTDLILIVIIIGGFLIRNYISTALIGILGNCATVFLLTQLICGVLVVIALIVRAIYRKFHKPTPYSPERRRALKYSLLYPVMSLAISLYGNRIERMEIVDRNFDIPIKNLPAELQNFTVAQISDVHLGVYFSLERLEKLLDRIAAAKPDILAITGDIFDDVDINDAAIKLVDSYCEKFKYGIYYCHGNHEHFRGIQKITAQLSNTKIHWLVNQSAPVTSNLYVLGVDYPPAAPVMKSGGRGKQDELFFAQMKNYLEKSLENVPYNATVILLAHHPEFFDVATLKNIPLTLTGHTHGAQVWGLHLLEIFKYTRGMYQHDDCYCYVNSGCGSWFCFRLLTPPEVAYFTLKNKN